MSWSGGWNQGVARAGTGDGPGVLYPAPRTVLRGLRFHSIRVFNQSLSSKPVGQCIAVAEKVRGCTCIGPVTTSPAHKQADPNALKTTPKAFQACRLSTRTRVNVVRGPYQSSASGWRNREVWTISSASICIVFHSSASTLLFARPLSRDTQAHYRDIAETVSSCRRSAVNASTERPATSADGPWTSPIFISMLMASSVLASLYSPSASPFAASSPDRNRA
ncbi:hypothetical protein MRB53_041845 [Persea americana]|nr:hypothetical protein MRB53_041845 [Persea americana]